MIANPTGMFSVWESKPLKPGKTSLGATGIVCAVAAALLLLAPSLRAQNYLSSNGQTYTLKELNSDLLENQSGVWTNGNQLTKRGQLLCAMATNGQEPINVMLYINDNPGIWRTDPGRNGDVTDLTTEHPAASWMPELSDFTAAAIANGFPGTNQLMTTAWKHYVAANYTNLLDGNGMLYNTNNGAEWTMGYQFHTLNNRFDNLNYYDTNGNYVHAIGLAYPGGTNGLAAKMLYHDLDNDLWFIRCLNYGDTTETYPVASVWANEQISKGWTSGSNGVILINNNTEAVFDVGLAQGWWWLQPSYHASWDMLVTIDQMFIGSGTNCFALLDTPAKQQIASALDRLWVKLNSPSNSPDWYDHSGYTISDMIGWMSNCKSEWATGAGIAYIMTNWPRLTANGPPGTAANPTPANGTTNLFSPVVLGWTGSNAASYNVYFGTENPPPFQKNQVAATFSTGSLPTNTVYYWQIASVNPLGTNAGPVWSFTTASQLPYTINTVGNYGSLVATSATAYAVGAFASDVATAYAINNGGVVNFETAFTASPVQRIALGAGDTMVLTISNSTGNITWEVMPLSGRQTSSGTGCAEGKPNLNVSLLNLDGAAPNEQVVGLGLVVMNRTNYPGQNVQVTVIFNNGSSTSAVAYLQGSAENDTPGSDNTFYGFQAPAGLYITQFSVTMSNGTFTCIDDLAFITGAFSTASPTLNVSLQAGQLLLSWPQNSSGFSLFCSTNLGPGAVWTPVAALPVLIGNQHISTNPMTLDSQFFRLEQSP